MPGPGGRRRIRSRPSACARGADRKGDTRRNIQGSAGRALCGFAKAGADGGGDGGFFGGGGGVSLASVGRISVSVIRHLAVRRRITVFDLIRPTRWRPSRRAESYTVAAVPKITLACDDSTPPLPCTIATSCLEACRAPHSPRNCRTPSIRINNPYMPG